MILVVVLAVKTLFAVVVFWFVAEAVDLIGTVVLVVVAVEYLVVAVPVGLVAAGVVPVAAIGVKLLAPAV